MVKVEVVSRQCRQGKKNTCYHLPRISSVLENKLETESNTGSALSTQSLPTPPPLTPSSFLSPLPSPPPPPYEMSQQLDYSTIIRQLQEQIITLSKQVAGRTRGEAAGLEVAKLQVFDRTPSKVLGFVTACELYGKARMRGVLMEEQIQWILSYMQGGMVDIWKENVLEELEAGELEFEMMGEFLAEIKREFGGGEEE